MDPAADKLGILLYGMAVQFVVVGLVLTSFGVYYNFDPGFFFFELIFPPLPHQSLITKMLCLAGRIILSYWSVLEVTRSYAIMLIILSAFLNVLVRCFKKIGEFPVSYYALAHYIIFQLILSIGQKFIRYVAGALLICGFVATVVGNWISLLGWKFIPFEINISICLITIIVYLGISVCVPVPVSLHLKSKTVLRAWILTVVERRRVFENRRFSAAKAWFQLWRKVCVAQQPIILYWGTSKFQRETKALYYSRIMEYTLTSMLGYKVVSTN